MTARLLFTFVIGASLLASAALVGAQGGPPQGGRPGGMRGGPGGPGGPGGRGGGMMKFLDDELKKVKATPKQVKQVHAYMEKSRAEMDAYRKSHQNLKREDMRPMMEKRRAAQEKFLKSVLTGKQWKQWDADMKALRARFGGGRPGGMRGGPGGPGGPGAGAK